MKKFCVLLMFVFLVFSFAFSQKEGQNEGFKFGFKYENFSYLSSLLKSFELVNVSRYDWHMITRLQRLQGEESVSRLLFQTSYSSQIFRLIAIVGVGSLAYNYYQGAIQQEDKTVGGWSGESEKDYDLVPFEQKSNLGMVLGGEIDWSVKSDPFIIALNARYLWQEEAQSNSNLFYDFGEGSAYLQYGYHLQQADIRKTAHTEFLVGMVFSKKFGNWVLSGGPKAVFLETTHKGIGHWESKFQNFQFSSSDSFRAENDFAIKIKNQGFFFLCHLGYEMNFAEAFVESRIGFASGVSAGLNFKL